MGILFILDTLYRDALNCGLDTNISPVSFRQEIFSLMMKPIFFFLATSLFKKSRI